MFRVLIVSNDSHRGDEVQAALEAMGVQVLAFYRTKFFSLDEEYLRRKGLDGLPDLILSPGLCKDYDSRSAESVDVHYDEPYKQAQQLGIPCISPRRPIWTIKRYITNLQAHTQETQT